LTDVFSRLEGILECFPKKDKRNVLATLQTYWLLKRRSRNGLPLLRRLQVAIPPAVTTKVWLFCLMSSVSYLRLSAIAYYGWNYILNVMHFSVIIFLTQQDDYNNNIVIIFQSEVHLVKCSTQLWKTVDFTSEFTVFL